MEDRIFSIRSVVDVEQPQSMSYSHETCEHDLPDLNFNGDYHQADNSRTEFQRVKATNTLHTPASVLPNNTKDEGKNASDDSFDGVGSRILGDSKEQVYATQFIHTTTEEEHYLITGRDGALRRCEDEPIHMPGAVQSFGLLVALKEVNGRFPVHIVSENSRRIIGYSPQQLFKLDSFMDLFSEDHVRNILDHIDFIRNENPDVTNNGPEVLNTALHPLGEISVKLWCAIHISSANPDLIICEFELENDNDYPLCPPDEIARPASEGPPHQESTRKEFDLGDKTGSTLLKVLSRVRKKGGEAGPMQIVDIMSQAQERLTSAPDLDKSLEVLVRIIKELTGFHRIMIHRFDSSYNGKVISELVDSAKTQHSYRGLHFPASDIPRQARELYKINKVRLLYDRDLEPSRLVCRTGADVEHPLDLTHSYLRAMSPMHLKYLANMGVRASMSVSVNAFSNLWGLIACHSYGRGGMRVAFPVRKMCRLIGDMASRNIERLSYASRLRAKKLSHIVPVSNHVPGHFIASPEDLLGLLDADFGMLSIGSETRILGTVEQSQEALAILEYLRIKKFASIVAIEDIRVELPDLRYPPGFTVIAGLLYVPLSVGGLDFIVFFRKAQVKEVKWAGNANEKEIRAGTSDYLEPRTSFQVWSQTVVGKCREWSEEHKETATVLCLVYGKFVEVWRQNEAVLQNSRLLRLLLADSVHEVRTPLNAIINYLEIALEGNLDPKTRDNLAEAHSASKSLIYAVNDLLNLTRIEERKEPIGDGVLDL
ncbi:GAF domain-like protein [Truncatella angustata]|uniref:GAF domain-like protein n=1 Tax=Truncatella angustata TaxID=152316 RepID=A0A9P8UB93_9PEZI|nr:GAF domain-like protein [Truncatella angustata]KAH6645722.1 GAF domain-like protein [Truncatella angustata]